MGLLVLQLGRLYDLCPADTDPRVRNLDKKVPGGPGTGGKTHLLFGFFRPEGNRSSFATFK